jgi:hypothetical protein
MALAQIIEYLLEMVWFSKAIFFQGNFLLVKENEDFFLQYSKIFYFKNEIFKLN